MHIAQARCYYKYTWKDKKVPKNRSTLVEDRSIKKAKNNNFSRDTFTLIVGKNVKYTPPPPPRHAHNMCSESCRERGTRAYNSCCCNSAA